MRIRARKSPASASSQHSVFSSSSTSSATSSSITSAHSSLDSSLSTVHRCRGLDLLVKAIHQVTAGSVIGVPYIQRRVTTRRRRRSPVHKFDTFVCTKSFSPKENKKSSKNRKKSDGFLCNEKICIWT